jgi:hypothetical protein
MHSQGIHISGLRIFNGCGAAVCRYLLNTHTQLSPVIHI